MNLKLKLKNSLVDNRGQKQKSFLVFCFDPVCTLHHIDKGTKPNVEVQWEPPFSFLSQNSQSTFRLDLFPRFITQLTNYLQLNAFYQEQPSQIDRGLPLRKD